MMTRIIIAAVLLVVLHFIPITGIPRFICYLAIYLEIGCGKGKFITAHAEREPNCNFIACEGQASVVLRALEKAEEKSLDNLRVFIDYVHDLSDYFAQGEIAGIYQ